MSYIDHRCNTCGHWATHHYPPNHHQHPDQCQNCTCRRVTPQAEAELATTYDRWGKPTTHIVAPGANVHIGGPPVTTCGCDSCRALHRTLTDPAKETSRA